jgi:hypothetical protein
MAPITFGGDGDLIDQILVSRSLLVDGHPFSVQDDTARIEAFPELTDHRKSRGAVRFGLPKGDPAKNVDQDGYSDHFPVSVVISETE